MSTLALSRLEDSPAVLSSPLILAHPTATERLRIWKTAYPHWGDGLGSKDYIDREIKNLQFCQGHNNLANWILTDGGAADQRPLFSACETYMKRAIIAGKEGDLRHGTCYAVASVFTFDEYQGKGYAKKLMTLLAEELRGVADFSVLWSDIGPKFYESVGWKPFKSTFYQLPATGGDGTLDYESKPIKFDDIPHIVKLDEKILREKLTVPSPKVRALILPDLSTIEWHLFHEAFVCQRGFSRTPSIHGALYTSPNPARSEVWAIWKRNIYGKKRENNTIYVVRLVIEDDSISSDNLKIGIIALCRMAQKEANEWFCSTVEIWNPDDRVKKAIEGIKDLGAKFVTQENHHLGSMRWLKEGSIDEVDWVCNEGFAWC